MSRFDGSLWATFDAGNSLVLGTTTIALCDDRHGHLWCVTEGGLTMFDGTTWVDYQGERWPILNTVKVTAIFVDETDFVWLGTYSQGVIGFGPTIR